MYNIIKLLVIEFYNSKIAMKNSKSFQKSTQKLHQVNENRIEDKEKTNNEEAKILPNEERIKDIENDLILEDFQDDVLFNNYTQAEINLDSSRVSEFLNISENAIRDYEKKEYCHCRCDKLYRELTSYLQKSNLELFNENLKIKNQLLEYYNQANQDFDRNENSYLNKTNNVLTRTNMNANSDPNNSQVPPNKSNDDGINQRLECLVQELNRLMEIFEKTKNSQ